MAVLNLGKRMGKRRQAEEKKLAIKLDYRLFILLYYIYVFRTEI